MFIVVVSLCIIAGIIVFFAAKTKKNRVSRSLFYKKGRESHCSNDEIKILFQLQKKVGSDEPLALFQSIEKLDVCIRAVFERVRAQESSGGNAGQKFLGKLLEFRKKLELQKLEAKKGIANTREIEVSQQIKIIIPGIDVFQSTVLKNEAENLAASMPETGTDEGGSSLPGKKVTVYFWRREDAEYMFNTQITDIGLRAAAPRDTESGSGTLQPDVKSLLLKHQSVLFRSQKRKSIRIKLSKSAELYPKGKVSNDAQTAIKGILRDISDSGCAIVLKGIFEPEGHVIVMFQINDETVSLSGTIRAIQQNTKKEFTLAHVELDTLPIRLKNLIQAIVFGIIPTEEDSAEEFLAFQETQTEAR
jgi:hypothetical protein